MALRTATPNLWTTSLDRASDVPLSSQLAANLRRAIAENRLRSGARVPSTRDLSREIGVSRSTVVAVFEQLVAEGAIQAKAGSGYYVTEHEPVSRAAPRFGGSRQVSRQGVLARTLPRTARTGAARPFEIGNAEADSVLISTWKRLAAKALNGSRRFEHFYDDPAGHPQLRSALAEYLSSARAVRCRPEQIIVTTGTHQSLNLAVRLLLNPGDRVWTEDPCYQSARDILTWAGADIAPVPVDAGGMNIGAMPDGELAARLIYLTPSNQFPLGSILPLSRRLDILDYADRNGSWILEDDYDSEFHYDGRAISSLQGLDNSGRVLYLGTFSKAIFPSLRLGYMVVPDDLVETFSAGKQLLDRQSSSLLQLIAADFIAEGHLARHVKRMRETYADHLVFLQGILDEHLPRNVTVQRAERGMHIIVWLPAHWSDRDVSAMLLEKGVSARPISSLSIAIMRPPGLVLGYTGYARSTLRRGVDVLSAVLKRYGRTQAKVEETAWGDQRLVDDREVTRSACPKTVR